MCRLLFEKELTKTDCGKLGRIVLPRSQVESSGFPTCKEHSKREITMISDQGAAKTITDAQHLGCMSAGCTVAAKAFLDICQWRLTAGHMGLLLLIANLCT